MHWRERCLWTYIHFFCFKNIHTFFPYIDYWATTVSSSKIHFSDVDHWDVDMLKRAYIHTHADHVTEHRLYLDKEHIVYIYAYMHTYICRLCNSAMAVLGQRMVHTYIHTYIHTYGYSSRSLLAWPHTFHTCIRTYTHIIYMHVYIRTYIHSHIHTYIHTYTDYVIEPGPYLDSE
jgi:hypothetical protein